MDPVTTNQPPPEKNRLRGPLRASDEAQKPGGIIPLAEMKEARLGGFSAGLAAGQLAALRQVQVTIADLPGTLLGLATADRITLDMDAAGYGWYTAAVPQTADDGAARMDLLTAVLHELGHVAGLEDESEDPAGEDLMSGWLLPGTRRLPTLADVDAVFGDLAGIAD